MRQVNLNVYKFEELSDKGQAKVLSQLHDINTDQKWWDATYDDANNIEMYIDGFDIDERYISGGISQGTTAIDVIMAIEKEHGEHCDTYKLAQEYKAKFSVLSHDDEEHEELTEKFKKDILKLYLKMLIADYDYLTSEEQIIESIKENDYEFTIDCKIYNELYYTDPTKKPNIRTV